MPTVTTDAIEPRYWPHVTLQTGDSRNSAIEMLTDEGGN